MTRADARIISLDAVRGLVMAIMALDHVREFFHADAMVFQAEDLARTTPILFLTRWITHVCAPGFVFLAGLAAARRLRRGGSPAELSRYLAMRGLWLVLLEITVMRFALNFRFSAQDPVLLIILVALGLSMVALAGLVWLPRPAIGAFGAAVVIGHNLLDPLRPADFGAWAPLWNLVHDPGAFSAAGRLVIAGYPVLPWAGLMAVGFAAGAIYDLDPAARRRILVRSGLAFIGAFVALRAVNAYGDPSPWSVQATPVMTVLSFLRTTKYPPSLQFLLMTIGPVLLLLAWFERRRVGAARRARGHRPRPALLLRRALLSHPRRRVTAGRVAIRTGGGLPVGTVPVDGRVARRLSRRLRPSAVGHLRRVDRRRRRDVPAVSLVRAVQA